ncbi:hypothetical protein [Streptococcus suis]|uniref:hypothetical protein n=1 Tax=Streptococcus suis TaxID=1307 RepID=UPI00041736EE|nr:hypothetical protein [Streptococcus suis]HEL1601649.1 hypothetical protein [Streptococcus suis]HEL9647287.1 hypothetical protein [Streptococcus suis]HEM2799505.1 hypothetical protein [Streptococcus suis]HEM3209305.1 hypothetical protein [Streptococcus suis 22083]HEM3937857.1 hypothetical protein [Streptococcus suis]
MKRLSTPIFAALGFFLIVFVALNQFGRVPGTSYQIISELVLYNQATEQTYEFENHEVRKAFIRQLSSTSSRGFQASDSRTSLEATYHETIMSENLISSIYGGEEGRIMEFSRPRKTALGNLIFASESVSYPVFARKYGNIRLETTILCQGFRVEQRLANQSNWVDLGTYTVKNLKETRYVPIYWE